jgi:stress-induced morphogen
MADACHISIITQRRRLTMPMTASDIEKRIKAALPDAQIELRDLAGDDNHWAATIISEQFRGKSRVQQHQLVNAAFGADMGTTLHSLSVQTKAPE